MYLFEILAVFSGDFSYQMDLSESSIFDENGCCCIFDVPTKKRVLLPSTVQNVLSIMFSCGMYDYSGRFSFSIGFPAKSGVGGCIFAVIPDKCGIATFSPPLDECGNSAKGTAMFNENARLPGLAFWKLVKKERHLKIALEFWKILRPFSGIF